jgi:hypothetical protein
VHTTYTSVLTRRVRINSDYATLPYEAGWATEAVFFMQAEGDHPDLTMITEISPDGITWVTRGEPRVLGEAETIAETNLTTFGNWLRLRVEGATEDRPARILVHVNLKG